MEHNFEIISDIQANKSLNRQQCLRFKMQLLSHILHIFDFHKDVNQITGSRASQVLSSRLRAKDNLFLGPLKKKNYLFIYFT